MDKRVVWITVLGILSHFAYGQMSKDSLRIFQSKCNECQSFQDINKTDKAIDCYTELIRLYGKQTKLLTRMASLYYEKKDMVSSLQWANQAIDINPEEAHSPLLFLAKKMNANGNPTSALNIINRLSVSTLDSTRRAQLEKDKQAIEWQPKKSIPTIAGVVMQNLGDSINTKENEYLPSSSLDGQQLIFTRNVGGNEDFFISTLDTNQQWKKAINMGYPPNTGLPDGAASLSADGHYLFYTRCDMRSPNGIEGGGCDIAFSYKEDSSWSSPQFFGYTINTINYEGQPCLSSDDVDLYFVSDRAGGFGGKDIWVSHFVNSLWTAPENLGPSINTGRDETAPYIHPDNETLYFSSDGHPGLGKSDLFMSRKNSDGTWRSPTNLGAPINTPGFDGSIYVNARGDKGYCASDRSDTKGGLDIYSFNTYPGIKPLSTICLSGFVTDKFTKEKLKLTRLQLQEWPSLHVVAVLESNRGDASYSKALTMNTSYLLTAQREGYRTYRKRINLVDTLPDNYEVNIKLRKPGIIDTLYSDYFHMDSTHQQLDSVSVMKLDSLYEAYKTWSEDSATVTILLNGYYYSGDTITDTNFAKYLSECEGKLNLIERYFERKKVPCHHVMSDMDMIIYNDEADLFDQIDVMVVEHY